MKRVLVGANICAIALVVLYGGIEYGAPAAAVRLWSNDYKVLMFACDHAMREHYIAKQAMTLTPNESSVKNLEAAEVGLLDCHDYDKMRKRMLVWGVSEDRLAAIGLEALESKAYELRRFVEIHEIRY
jgi:hypothetical protein